MEYKWQGEPVKVEFGYGIVNTDEEKPLYWYNYECETDPSGISKTEIPAVRVTYKDQVFVIANHFGCGVHKLENGGWPNIGHMSLPDDSFKPCKDEWCYFPKYDRASFSEYEKERRLWQEQTYPEEYAKSEALKEAIKDSPLFKK